jgi:dipeptidyl aminopeptidase/acylaminoacyl peptidase
MSGMSRTGVASAAWKRVFRAAVFTSLACGGGVAEGQARPATAPVSFYREVFPIFRTACAGCHNGETAAGGLNLSSYLAAAKGGRGGALFVPGKSADSRLQKYLTGALKPQMPPGGTLKQADIDRIRQWIDAGAKADTPPVESRKPGSGKPVAVRTRTVVIKPGAPYMLRKSAPVTALAFAPDGKILAVGTYREVQFWSLETKTIASRWTGHTDTVRALVYSKDGRMLAAGGGIAGATGEVRLWEVGAGKEVRAFGDDADAINGIAFSPDGARVATASSDKLVKTWETATGKLIATGKDHSDAVWGIAWSPDGKYLASCGADRTVKVWDAAAMKRLYSLGGHEDVISSVEFAADGKTVITASADRTARVWNVGPEGGSSARTLSGHGRNVTNAAFAPSGGTVTASGDKTVKLWDAGGGNTRTLTDAKDWVYVARFSKDGKTVAAGTWDGMILLWSATDGKLIGQLSTGPHH